MGVALAIPKGSKSHEATVRPSLGTDVHICNSDTGTDGCVQVSPKAERSVETLQG